VTELLTCVLTTLQLTVTDLETDVFGLKVLVGRPLLSSSLGRLSLTRAAAFSALMTSAVELCFADPEAHGWLEVALMANRVDCSPPTTT
jgi:hypothetical protein